MMDSPVPWQVLVVPQWLSFSRASTRVPAWVSSSSVPSQLGAAKMQILQQHTSNWSTLCCCPCLALPWAPGTWFGQNLRYDPFWLCSSGCEFLCSVCLKTLFCPRCQSSESSSTGPAQPHLEPFLAGCNKAAVISCDIRSVPRCWVVSVHVMCVHKSISTNGS